MAKTLVLVLLALVGSLAQAQHVRWDNTATTTTGVGQMLPVLALPGASISFYTGCTALPCAAPAVTYQSDSGASCPSNAQVVWQAAVGTGCHATADSEGNFGGWFAPGDYQYTITINSTTAGPYDFAVGSGGGTPVMNLQHNSSPTGILQSLYNLCDNGSCGPALDAGMQQVIAKTGTNDGSWMLETAAAAGSIQPTYQVPVAGQHIIMLPYSCSGYGAGFATPSCGAAPGYSMSLSIYTKAPFGQASITDTGWAYNGVEGLPSFVSAANVTAVYGGVTSWWTGGSYQTTCGGPNFDAWSNGTNTYSPGLSGHFPYTATTTLTQIDGGSPTTFNYTTGYLSIGNQQSTLCSGTSTRVAIPYLVVYYTGTAPPASTNLNIAQPLTLTNNTLGFLWPNNEALDTGTSTAYAISIPWMTLANIGPGTDVWVDPANTNTVTNPTLNLNSFGAGNILGPGSGAIEVGDIVAGQMAHLVYGADGNWHLQNLQSAPGLSANGVAGQVAYFASSGRVISPVYLGNSVAPVTVTPPVLDVKSLPAIVGSGVPSSTPAITYTQACQANAASCVMGSNVTSGHELIVTKVGGTATPTDTLGTAYSLIYTSTDSNVKVYAGTLGSTGADTVTVTGATNIGVEEVAGVSATVDTSYSTSGCCGGGYNFSATLATGYQSDYLMIYAASTGATMASGIPSAYPFTVDKASSTGTLLAHAVVNVANSYSASFINVGCTTNCQVEYVVLALKTSTTTPTNGRNYYNSAASYACYVADGTNWNACGGGGASGTANYIPLFVTPTTLGNSHLDDGATTAGTITATETVVSTQTLKAQHFLALGTPTFAGRSGCDSSFSGTGTDLGGVITCVTAGAPAGSNAQIALIQYQYWCPTISYVTLTPANNAAAALTGAQQIYAQGTQSVAVILTGVTALSTSTTYQWNYHIDCK